MQYQFYTLTMISIVQQMITSIYSKVSTKGGGDFDNFFIIGCTSLTTSVAAMDENFINMSKFSFKKSQTPK